MVFDTGPFTFTADYFRIDMSDRIGITSNFVLTPAEKAAVVAGGFEAAESVRNYRFFTNAFATTSQDIDVVSTWTPLALRGNTVISAVFNHTGTEVTDNASGLLDGRRLAEYAYALPRTRRRRSSPMPSASSTANTHRGATAARTTTRASVTAGAPEVQGTLRRDMRMP